MAEVIHKEISPKAARRYLRTVSDGRHFRAHDGTAVRNLWELYAFLKNCDEDSFRHHVDGSKNDFAVWVKDVVMDEDLAGYLEYCLARGAMTNRLLGRINFLVATSSKKLTMPKKAEVILEESRAPEELFITADGRAIRSLWEMLDFIKTSKQEAFAHHVNERRNDIANWVEEIVLDDALSDKIRKAKDRDEMHALVLARLKDLEKMTSPKKPRGDVYHLQLVGVIKPL